jgi:hypothetical protein
MSCLWANVLSVADSVPKGRCTLSVKLSDFTVWRHTWRKNWVNCAVLTAIAQASELPFPVVFDTENWAVHSGSPTVTSVYLPTPRWHHLKAHPFLETHSAIWASHDIFLFKYHFLLHILRFLFFFSDNIVADVTSKQQTTALFLSTIVTGTRRHTELTKKNWQTWWETCAVPENIQFSFSCNFFLNS